MLKDIIIFLASFRSCFFLLGGQLYIGSRSRSIENSGVEKHRNPKTQKPSCNLQEGDGCNSHQIPGWKNTETPKHKNLVATISFLTVAAPSQASSGLQNGPKNQLQPSPSRRLQLRWGILAPYEGSLFITSNWSCYRQEGDRSSSSLAQFRLQNRSPSRI